MLKPDEIVSACTGELYRYRLAVLDQLPRIEEATRALRVERDRIEKAEEEFLVAPSMSREAFREQLESLQDVDENELVPLALIALEVGEPVELVADPLGDVVQLDDVGMRTVPATAAREFLAGRAEQAARMEDQARRLQEMAGSSPVVAGVPAVEGATPFESLMGSDRSYVSPSEEFGGRPKPRFLQEELEAGARQQAAARAQVPAKKAAREDR